AFLCSSALGLIMPDKKHEYNDIIWIYSRSVDLLIKLCIELNKMLPNANDHILRIVEENSHKHDQINSNISDLAVAAAQTFFLYRTNIFTLGKAIITIIQEKQMNTLYKGSGLIKFYREGLHLWKVT
ncbi:hypothetical protein ACJX0J_038365, partial [Zea mays]